MIDIKIIKESTHVLSKDSYRVSDTGKSIIISQAKAPDGSIRNYKVNLPISQLIVRGQLGSDITVDIPDWLMNKEYITGYSPYGGI